MTVIAASAVPEHLRGALTRWMLEVTPQVYVGTISAKVRQQLWDIVKDCVGEGSSVLIHPDNNEQGFTVHTTGPQRRQPLDFDGLTLMAFQPPITEQPPFDNEMVDW